MLVINQGEILRFLRVVDPFTALLAEGLTHHSGVCDLRDNSEACALLFILCLLVSSRSSLTNFLKQAASILDSWSCSLLIHTASVDQSEYFAQYHYVPNFKGCKSLWL